MKINAAELTKELGMSVEITERISEFFPDYETLLKFGPEFLVKLFGGRVTPETAQALADLAKRTVEQLTLSDLVPGLRRYELLNEDLKNFRDLLAREYPRVEDIFRIAEECGFPHSELVDGSISLTRWTFFFEKLFNKGLFEKMVAVVYSERPELIGPYIINK